MCLYWPLKHKCTIEAFVNKDPKFFSRLRDWNFAASLKSHCNLPRRGKSCITYRVDDMFVDDIATYVSLNWLDISKFPLDMMYPYWWTTHMQKMSHLSI
jgi:hypothetical protein